MDQLPIQINVSTNHYLKNPDQSKLGRNIVTHSIELINELGFESFTIKKLSIRIGSPESSIYRYFESKYMLLIYLINWYWGWMEYRLVFAIHNLSNPKQKLETAITFLTESVKNDSSFSHINEILLDRIIMTEAVKAYFTKQISNDTQKSHFTVYKRVVQRISDIIIEINPNYPYSHMLISTVIEGAHQQRYFAENLPSLTDNDNDPKYITNFYTQLVANNIKHFQNHINEAK